MEGLFKLDGLILAGFEKFSHRWQKLTGHDCFWLGKLSLVLAFLGFSLYFSWFALLLGFNFAVILGPTFMFVSIVPAWLLNVKAKKIVTQYANNGYSNPFKVSYWRSRISCLFAFSALTLLAVGVFSLVGVGYILYFLFYNCFEYFLACDPLPPAKSKIKKWLEAGASAAKRFLAPVQEPIPSPS